MLILLDVNNPTNLTVVTSDLRKSRIWGVLKYLLQAWCVSGRAEWCARSGGRSEGAVRGDSVGEGRRGEVGAGPARSPAPGTHPTGGRAVWSTPPRRSRRRSRGRGRGRSPRTSLPPRTPPSPPCSSGGSGSSAGRTISTAQNSYMVNHNKKYNAFKSHLAQRMVRGRQV